MHTKLWQPYDEQGRPLPEGANQHEIAILGKLHGAAHVWLWRKTGASIELLLQKRADQKITWPGLFDKSAGGHCMFGETPITTALRKLEDELGIKSRPEALQFIGVNRYYQTVSAHMTGADGTDLIENEIQWVYLADGSQLTIQPAPLEAASVSWKPLDELVADLTNRKRRSQYVPIPHAYITLLEQALATVPVTTV